MPRRNIAKYLNPWMFGREKRRKKFEAIHKRDGDNCWRCHQPMDFSEPRDKKKSATIEHLTAKTNGGTLALDNVVLCHRGCNKHLGTNTPEHKERMRLRRVKVIDARACPYDAARATAEGSRRVRDA
jgi:hypothetical protein